MRYYIADSHFFHDALNDQMDKRGFGSMEEMNQYMLKQWNKKVRNNDDVIILGDLSWGKPEETSQLLDQLNGTLYLIRGNHDSHIIKSEALTQKFQWIKSYEELQDNRRKVVLCHYPIMCYKGQYRLDAKGNPRAYMLYGHVHDSQDQRLMEQFQYITRNTLGERIGGEKQLIPCNMINCFCKYSDYQPLTLDEWIENQNQRIGENEDGIRTDE